MCIRAAATAAIQNAHAAASTVAASTTATRALTPKKNEESMKICVRTWVQKIDLTFSTTNRLQMEKD